MINRNEINAAIREVITTPLKRDAKEAHKAVKAAGYTVTSVKGGYGVINGQRFVSIGYARNGRALRIFHGPYNSQSTMIKADTLSKFDYVGCLEKPVNNDYYAQKRFECDGEVQGERKEQRARLLRERNYVRYADEEIARLEKEMAELQAKLERAMARKANAEKQLSATRTELGLAG